MRLTFIKPRFLRNPVITSFNEFTRVMKSIFIDLEDIRCGYLYEIVVHDCSNPNIAYIV